MTAQPSEEQVYAREYMHWFFKHIQFQGSLTWQHEQQSRRISDSSKTLLESLLDAEPICIHMPYQDVVKTVLRLFADLWTVASPAYSTPKMKVIDLLLTSLHTDPQHAFWEFRAQIPPYWLLLTLSMELQVALNAKGNMDIIFKCINSVRLLCDLFFVDGGALHDNYEERRTELALIYYLL
jgi:hypothetical protein